MGEGPVWTGAPLELLGEKGLQEATGVQTTDMDERREQKLTTGQEFGIE